MRCCDVEALWDELRECEDRGNETVAIHLKGCPDCRAIFRANDALLRAIEQIPQVEAPDGLCARILQQIKSACGQQAVADILSRLHTPIGDIYVACNETAVTYVAVDQGDGPAKVAETIERRLHHQVREADPPEWLAGLVKNFFSSWTIDLDRIDLSELTPFEAAALRKAAEIPPGHVRSYGWIAAELGQPKAARAVGRAMARNPVALFIPCHRVVDARGNLHQYAYGLDIKARLLALEGYLVEHQALPRAAAAE